MTTQTHLLLIFNIGIGILCVFGCFSNILSFVIFQMDKKKTPAKFLLQVMAVVDFLILVLVFIMVVILPLLTYPTFGYPLIPINTILRYLHARADFVIRPIMSILNNTSTALTIMLAVIRTIAVVWPFKATELITMKKVQIALVISIIINIVFALPDYFLSELKTVHYANNVTLEFAVNTEFTNKNFEIVYYYLVFFKPIKGTFLPFSMLVPLTVLLIVKLRKSMQTRGSLTTYNKKNLKETRLTQMLIGVILIYVVCKFPTLFDIILLYAGLFHSLKIRAFRDFTLYTVMVINSSINVILYINLSTDYRVIAKRLFCKLKRKQSKE